jgi:methylmalonyl-CoA mutase
LPPSSTTTASPPSTRPAGHHQRKDRRGLPIRPAAAGTKQSTSKTIIIPPERTRYLAEIAETVRDYHRQTESQADALRRVWHLEETARTLSGEGLEGDRAEAAESAQGEIDNARESAWTIRDGKTGQSGTTPATLFRDELVYRSAERRSASPLHRVPLPPENPQDRPAPIQDPGEIYSWLRRENLPGYFPFTAGVFPMKRMGEDPTRMFAGEGDPARTNRRFKMLSANSEAKRLSTAFDSVTLYGYDPDRRPDIYGKVGNSGVSVCTLDDVKVLYGGFELCAPTHRSP